MKVFKGGRRYKMPTITNKNYKLFFKEGIITPITEDHIKAALANIDGKYSREGRALLITMYYTGARPNEVLNLKGKDIVKEDSYIVFKMPASKGGLPRPVYLPYRKELAREAYQYATGVYQEMFLFYHYRGNYVRYKDGKEIKEITSNLRYYFKRWFTSVIDGSISPYYLRHNRFSKMSIKGASMEEIMKTKGAKTMASVNPYIHMSTKSAKRIARFID